MLTRQPCRTQTAITFTRRHLRGRTTMATRNNNNSTSNSNSISSISISSTSSNSSSTIIQPEEVRSLPYTMIVS